MNTNTISIYLFDKVPCPLCQSEYCNKNFTKKNVWAHVWSKGSFEVVKKVTKHMLIDSSSKLSTLDFMRTHKRI